jgi:recombination protein RecR
MSESEARETILDNLINQLARLPSIGRKTAQRLAYHLMAQDSGGVQDLARALTEAKSRIHACMCCGNYTERETCRICTNDRRQHNLICVVEKPADILAFERTGTFPGVYHVLGGTISPLDGIGPGELNFSRLWDRSLQADVELILALNTNAEGEATSTFIVQKLSGKGVKITRLARGIPVGSELEYIDELTVQRALESRVEMG